MPVIRIGKVVACHGVRGFVRVACESDPPLPFVMEASEIYLEAPGHPPRQYTVEAIKPYRAGVILKLSGFDSRTAAEELLGAFLGVPEEVLPPLGANEFYYYEIVGYRVRTTDGKEIGTIRETLPTGSNDVWVVRQGSREHLIPVIVDVVMSIDRDSKTVTIEPPEGLMDL